MQNVFWTAYSNQSRTAAISQLEEIISRYGYIVQFQPFSDLSLSIQIEIAESQIDALYASLEKQMRLDAFEKINSASDRERNVFLNITFIKGLGNLKIEVPAVPG
jgi:hypothetical protein